MPLLIQVENNSNTVTCQQVFLTVDRDNGLDTGERVTLGRIGADFEFAKCRSRGLSFGHNRVDNEQFRKTGRRDCGQ
jgi:hypothetical protein